MNKSIIYEIISFLFMNNFLFLFIHSHALIFIENNLTNPSPPEIAN